MSAGLRAAVALLCILWLCGDVRCAIARQPRAATSVDPPRRLPSLKWRTEFGDGASFGDPINVCLRGPHSSQLCTFVVLVFNSTTYGNASVVSLDAALGMVLWSYPVPLACAMPSYSGWVTPGLSGGRDAFGNDVDTIFTATCSRLYAIDARSGDLVWSVPLQFGTARHGHAGSATAAVPAHPTYFEGRVFYTFENGVSSSVVTAVNATTGVSLWQSQDIAVTLIWPLRLPSLIAYVGRNVTSGDVHVVARRASGEVAWSHGPLAWTTPGLWDNPNLDADDEGAVVFMYQKPHVGLRQIHAFDATNGQELWSVNDTDAESILDYDTYAYDGDFFRLMTRNASEMLLQRLDGVTGDLKWSSPVATGDSDSVLLVSGRMAFSFGLSSKQVLAYGALDGTFAWSERLLLGSPTTGVTLRVSGDVPDGTAAQATLLAFGSIPDGAFVAVVAADREL